jgi:hypothetical protein
MAVAPAPRAPQTSAAIQAVSRNISEWNATLIRARRPLPFPNTGERGPKSDGFCLEYISEEHITTPCKHFSDCILFVSRLSNKRRPESQFTMRKPPLTVFGEVVNTLSLLMHREERKL